MKYVGNVYRFLIKCISNTGAIWVKHIIQTWKLKGHVNPKIHIFSYYVKSGVENEFEISFVQFDLF